MPGPEPEVTSVRVSVRLRGGGIEERAWDTVPAAFLQSAAPWRTFRWYEGQRHYSGTYWSATTGDHVIYESRLELARLLFADFDPSVRGIVAQPFLLTAVVDGRPCRHIPDYLLTGDDGPVVVDVKPACRLLRPEVERTLGWTRQAVQTRGWRYEVFHEPSPVVLANIRFLAGYRRFWLLRPGLVEELRGTGLDGMTLGRAVASVPGHAEEHVRAAVYHLLWNGHVTVDLGRPLSSSQVLRRSS
ncbi:TnsA-like heteromeric transposase endonuclease subunit [Streptomyces abikoensis]|uniref:TnsA-like heteromeric transposase endonuclease subunit n=1 Tax=Streptomyces abikoensis TaxID=97398 RepID=A0ABW7THL8_9ACTN